MLDYPGLAAPKVAAANRAHLWTPEQSPAERMLLLIPELRPDWLVLRRREFQEAERLGVLGDYQFRKQFDVAGLLDERHPNLPGIGYLRYDSCFNIFERRR